jgi:hypothetical protein
LPYVKSSTAITYKKKILRACSEGKIRVANKAKKANKAQCMALGAGTGNFFIYFI